MKVFAFISVKVMLLGILMMSSLKCTLSPEKKLAHQLINEAGIEGGIIVHVGSTNGKLTTAFRKNDAYRVHGLSRDQEMVTKLRKEIKTQNLYGQISIDQLKTNYLPFIDNFVNLLVIEKAGEISKGEIMRVLTPDGIAMIKKETNWDKIVKPRPSELDDWTHYLYNAAGNPVSHDLAVDLPRQLQWVVSPKWSRHHDRMASMSALVSSDNRIFYILDEGPTSSIMLPSNWSLFCRDAFNGILLWKKSLDKWQTHFWPYKSGPAQLPRRLVAIDNNLYVTLGIEEPVSKLDAATGKIIQTYPETRLTEEFIVSKGILLALVAQDSTKWKSFKNLKRHDHPNIMKKRPWKEEEETIIAVNTDNGKVLWKNKTKVLPLTLSSDGEQVYFHNGNELICLNLETGNEVWMSKPLPRWSEIVSFFGPTLLVVDDVVLFAGGENMKFHSHGWDIMTALSSKTGEILWAAEHPPSGYQSPEDILVAKGVVYTMPTAQSSHSGKCTGRELYTGKVVTEFMPDVDTYWFHHRCYRAKGTENYLLPSRTGIEFVNPSAQHWDIHHWVRGGCLYGVMPANGFTYAPPHDCACYPEAKLYGFNALAAKSSKRKNLPHIPEKERLQKGPSYQTPVKSTEFKSGDEWPTYRHDALRSGNTSIKITADLNLVWENDIGGNLTSVVLAGKKLFVGQKDTHTLHALDVRDGDILWSYTVGSSIDSPPTINQGRVLFGSSDGCVYCLNANDGTLMWKFHAAPKDLKMNAFGQLESVWPVHGSVLVHEDLLYCVAGRSMFLDEGLRWIQLNSKTGEKIAERILSDQDPEKNVNLQNRIKVLNMPVALSDILSCDNTYIYMRSQKFDFKGNRIDLGPHSAVPSIQGSVQSGEGRHLFAPFGFLDDTWFHRSYWVYGRSFAGGHAGYYQAGRYTPGGRLLVIDETNIYGFGRKNEYFKWTTPLEYHLFSCNKDQVIKAINAQHPRIKERVKPEKKLAYQWSEEIPIYVRAMIKAGDILFIAGPPDLVDEEKALKGINDPEIQSLLQRQKEALAGKLGAKLWAVSAVDGKKQNEIILDTLPVWDGMAAAYGNLYLSTMDGRVLCYGE